MKVARTVGSYRSLEELDFTLNEVENHWQDSQHSDTSFASHLERNTLPAVLGKWGDRERTDTPVRRLLHHLGNWSMAKIRIRAVRVVFVFVFFTFSQYIWKIRPT